MAGDWLKWNKGLAQRREVLILSSILKIDRHEVAGRLMVLWEWCDDNLHEADIDPDTLDMSLYVGTKCPDNVPMQTGHLSRSCPDNVLALLGQVTGLPALIEALSVPEIRWITHTDDGRIVFKHLARHNGKSAKTRASESRKKANQRSRPVADLSRFCPDDNGTTSGPEKRRVREELKPPEPPKGGNRRRRMSKTERRNLELAEAVNRNRPKENSDANSDAAG